MPRFVSQFCLIMLLYSHPTISVAAASNMSTNTVFHPKGKVKFEKMAHSFGTVNRGEKLTYRFAFKNVGSGPLTIQGVHAACGCTATAVEPVKIFQPGMVGSIDVTLDTANFRGKLAKTVTVMTNERLLPARNLTVKANVVEEIAANPPVVNFGIIYGGVAKPQSVIISGAEGVEPEVTDVVYNEDLMEVSFAKIASGKWQVSIALKEGLPARFLKDTILVKNKSKSLKSLPILVRADVRGSIKHEPSYLEFGSLGEAAAATRYVDLTRLDQHDVTGSKIVAMNINCKQVTDVENYIKVAIPDSSSKRKRVAIEIANRAQQKGSVHGTLVFSTSDPLQQQFNVDFYAFFR